MKNTFILLLFVLCSMNAPGQICSPSLDQTFGTAGIALGNSSVGNTDAFYSRNILVQSDNKIIQVGGQGFGLIRYKSNGHLDSSFGINGRVVTAIGTSHSYASAGILQPDAKIIVAGNAYNVNRGVFALARYNTDGSLDNSFGTGGIVMTQVGLSNDYASGLAIQPDGKIVVVGGSYDTSNVTAFATVRYNSNGSIDSTFGTNGKIVSHLGHFITFLNNIYYGVYSYEYANSVMIQQDGKIVVAGNSYTHSGCYDYYGGIYCNPAFAMIRYNSNGSIDSAFGNNGKVFDSLSLVYQYAAVLQADGKILITGQDVGGQQGRIVTNRYNSNGNLDVSFGTNGKALTQIGGQDNYSHPRSIFCQPDGKIIVAGSTSANNNGSFAVVRYNTNGIADNSFNNNGIVVIHLGQTGSYDVATGVALQGDKIVVAGDSRFYSNTPSNNASSLMVIRLLENGFAFTPVISPAGAAGACQGDSVRLSTNETGTMQWYMNGIPINDATGSVYYAKINGSYSIAVTTAAGCGISASTKVIITSKPEITWSGSLIFCDGSSNSLFTTDNGNMQWYLNGNPINGATGTSFVATSSGSYSVTASGNGCSFSSSPVAIIAKSNAIPILSWNGPLNFCDGGNVILSTTTPDNRQWYKNGTAINSATGTTYTVTTSGSYTESNGCAVSAPVIVTIIPSPPKPPVNWNSNPYHFSTTSGYSGYQWYINNTIIPGASANIYTPAQTGLYKVQVTDVNNCSNTSDAFNLVALSTADIIVGDTKLRFYPNPAHTEFYIDIPQPTGKKLMVELYDLSGKFLKKQLLNQNHNTISVNILPAGMYQLVIYNGKEKAVRKVIVIK
jgi:uncharacterized delta-60 repeat protein